MYAGLRSEPVPVTQQVGGPSLLLEVQVTGETLVSPSVGANPLLLQVMVNVQGAESLQVKSVNPRVQVRPVIIININIYNCIISCKQNGVK